MNNTSKNSTNNNLLSSPKFLDYLNTIWEIFLGYGSFLRAGPDLGRSPVIERLFNTPPRTQRYYLIRDSALAVVDVFKWLVWGPTYKPKWTSYFFRQPSYELYLASSQTIWRRASYLYSTLKACNLVGGDYRPLHVLFNMPDATPPYSEADFRALSEYTECLCATPDALLSMLSWLPNDLQILFIWLFGGSYTHGFLFGTCIVILTTLLLLLFVSVVFIFIFRYICNKWNICDKIKLMYNFYSTSGISLGSSGAFSLSFSSFFSPVTKSVRTWPLTIILNKHLGDYPTPANLSYFWSFGSLAGVCLGVQLVTGIILAMHYVANAELAFASVEHIMRDVNGGWLMRYLHANGASFFFIAIYIHIARAVFYRSYVSNSLAWSSGVLIFFLLMATAFIGYVLPWGQMSYWGATVITNLFSAIPGIGIDLVWWLWGGFSVNNATLNRFFSLHYFLPIIIAAVALLHLYFLHGAGSSNPLGVNHSDKLPFFPYFVLKDVIGLFVFAFVFLFFVFYFPNVLGHFDNYIQANPFITPMHIVPEWYFLPFYAILRSIPNKLGGVLCMAIAILVLAVLPFVDASRLLISPRFSYFANNSFWLFLLATMLLGWLGGVPVQYPFVITGQLSTLVYFAFFAVLLPMVVGLEFYTLSSKTRLRF